MIVSTLRGSKAGVDSIIDLFEGFVIASPVGLQFHDRSPYVIKRNKQPIIYMFKTNYLKKQMPI